MQNSFFHRHRSLLGVAAIAAAIGVLVGIGVMYLWPPDGTTTTASTERKPKYYRNPMGSGHISDKPMKDDMGMDYIPVYDDEANAAADDAPGTVAINPSVMQNMGVRTAPVTKGNVAREIVANGVLALSETGTTTVTTKVDGYVEKLYVTAVGQAVRQGDLLFELNSPDLYALLEEYLGAVRYQESVPATASQSVHRNATDLVVSAHKRLLLLGIDRPQLAAIRSGQVVPNTVKFYANHSGVVLKKNVLEGGFIAAGTELFTLADLSELWVMADAYAQDFAALRVGQRARITIQGLPGKTYHGRVDFIYPTIDPQTRTVKVRVVLPNPNLQLRPDMYANVTIQVGGSARQLLVPKSALLRSKRDELVILALGEGRFRPQKIRIGGESGEYYAVLSGLKEGDVVVTSAQFLLDSESRIHEAIQKLNTGDSASTPEAESTEPKSEPAPPSPRASPVPKAEAPAKQPDAPASPAHNHVH